MEVKQHAINTLIYFSKQCFIGYEQLERDERIADIIENLTEKCRGFHLNVIYFLIKYANHYKTGKPIKVNKHKALKIVYILIHAFSIDEDLAALICFYENNFGVYNYYSKLFKSSGIITHYFGTFCLLEKNYTKAKSLFKQNVVRNFRKDKALNYLGIIYSRINNDEKAIDHYEKAIKLNNVKALLNAGILYYNNKLFSMAATRLYEYYMLSPETEFDNVAINYLSHIALIIPWQKELHAFYPSIHDKVIGTFLMIAKKIKLQHRITFNIIKFIMLYIA